jgi:DNA phosphorothioation-dependent restriction protein DptG
MGLSQMPAGELNSKSENIYDSIKACLISGKDKKFKKVESKYFPNTL